MVGRGKEGKGLDVVDGEKDGPMENSNTRQQRRSK